MNVKITSDEDVWAVKLMNLIGAVDSLLMGTPIRREIPIFGAPFGYDVFVTGLIDEIRVDEKTFDFDIVEFKTRFTKSLPNRAQKDTHRLQVLKNIRLYSTFLEV